MHKIDTSSNQQHPRCRGNRNEVSLSQSKQLAIDSFSERETSFLEGCMSSDKLKALQAKLNIQEYVGSKN